jgi:hypothetical protein
MPRLAYIDNLRTVLIMGVLMGHLSVTYGLPADWYYKEGGETSPLVSALGLVLLAMPVSRAAADEAERREFAASVAGYVGTVVAVIPESRTLIVDAPFRNDVLRIGADKARKIVALPRLERFRDWDDVAGRPGSRAPTSRPSARRPGLTTQDPRLDRNGPAATAEVRAAGRQVWRDSGGGPITREGWDRRSTRQENDDLAHHHLADRLEHPAVRGARAEEGRALRWRLEELRRDLDLAKRFRRGAQEA